MEFTWDPKKAEDNLQAHGVDFREAATAFDDPLSTTFPDVDHCVGEHRFLTIGLSALGRILVVSHTETAILFESSLRDWPHHVSDDSMKKTSQLLTDDLRPEYDFASMKGGIRGKYTRRAREGTNIVLIKPEVADAFPTERTVNEALKGVLKTARAVRSTGGLPNKALQPTSRAQRRSNRKNVHARLAAERAGR